jgi:hypothetical protein
MTKAGLFYSTFTFKSKKCDTLVFDLGLTLVGEGKECAAE